MVKMTRLKPKLTDNLNQGALKTWEIIGALNQYLCEGLH